MNEQLPHDLQVELSKSSAGPREPREITAPMVLQLGQPDQASGQALSFNVLWRSLLQRLTVAVPLGVVASVLAAAALYYFTEPKYRSLAMLEIQDKKQVILFAVLDPGAEFAQTQIELLKSARIIGQAIVDKELGELKEIKEIAGKEDAVLWIQTRLKAVRIGKSQLYEISFTTKTPTSAQVVVDAIVKTYMNYLNSETDSDRRLTLDVLDKEIKRYDAEIVDARTKLRDLTKLAPGSDQGVMTSVLGGPVSVQGGRYAHMSNLQHKLVDADLDIAVAKARIEQLESEMDPARESPDDSSAIKANERLFVSEAEIESNLGKDPAIAVLMNELKKKQEHLRRLDKSKPQFARMEEAIAAVKTEIDVKKAELKPVIEAELKEKLNAIRRDELKAAQANLIKTEQAAALLRAKTKDEKSEQTEHVDKSLEVQFARDALANLENHRRHMGDRKMNMITESGAKGQVQNTQKATLPEFQDGPTIAKKLAIVGVAGFFAPPMMLVGWNLVRRRIFDRQQLESEFDVRFVSEVASLPTRPLIPKPGSDRAYKLQSHLFQESINALRVTMASDETLQGMQVVVVASAVSGEGKTNLSSQLAMSWAQAGQGKVVILDCDLRKASLHQLFEVQPDPGMAEILRGECTLAEAMVLDSGGQLSIVPAGDSQSRTPANLFSGNRYRELLAELRQHFDKIIIDVPPVLCASETLLIAKQADGVLLCARHDYSHSAQVKHAYDRLAGAGVNIVGAVLNGTPVHKYSYTYRGYAPT